VTIDGSALVVASLGALGGPEHERCARDAPGAVARAELAHPPPRRGADGRGLLAGGGRIPSLAQGSRAHVGTRRGPGQLGVRPYPRSLDSAGRLISALGTGWPR
jgi:hypothetical protein